MSFPMESDLVGGRQRRKRAIIAKKLPAWHAASQSKPTSARFVTRVTGTRFQVSPKLVFPEESCTLGNISIL